MSGNKNNFLSSPIIWIFMELVRVCLHSNLGIIGQKLMVSRSSSKDWWLDTTP